MVYHRVLNSPVTVLEAVERYCRGEGSFLQIGDTLDVDTADFSRIMKWYMTNYRAPFSDEPLTPQALLNIILLELQKESRLERHRIEGRLVALERKVTRLHRTYPERDT